MQVRSKYTWGTDHRPINTLLLNKNVLIWLTFLFILIFPQLALSQSIDIKDEEANTMIQINDEGDNGGSILFPDAVSLDLTNNKLYNIGGDLYWNGVLIGPCNCDIARIEFDDLVTDFDDLDARITALETK